MGNFRLNKDFSYSLNILPNGEEIFDFENDRNTDDYFPFKNIQILNTGTEDLKIYFNNQNGYKLIPSGTIFERVNLNISYLKIINTSAVNNSIFTLTLDNDLSSIELLKALVLGKSELEK